jgi:hypothetical protein
MPIKHFHRLDETEQGEAVWDHGVLLSDHFETRLSISCMRSMASSLNSGTISSTTF